MQIHLKNLLLFIAILLILFCLFATTIFLPLQQDEGVFLTIAQGIKNGLLPYRDFFDHKPPAIYLLFGLLTLSTTKIIFYKLLLIAGHMAIAFLILLISKQLKIVGYYAMLFYLTLALIFEGQILIAEPFGAFFLLLALYIYLSKQKTIWVLFADLFIGIAVLFKQTFLLSIIPFFIYLIWQKKFQNLTLIFAGLLLPITAVLIWLMTLDLLTPAYQQIILYNFKYYPAENIFKVIRLMFVPFLYTLPIWALFISGAYKFARLSPSISNQIRLHSLILISLLAVIPMFTFFLRHYPHYWLQVAPFVAIVAASNLKCDFRANFNKILLGFIVISCLIFSYNFWHRNYPKYLAEHKIVNFLKHKNKPIYAENQFIGMYFLTKFQPPNQYLYITEITDWSEQAEIKTIATLKQTEHLIIWPADSNYPYAKTLQRYIFENYKPIFWQHDLGAAIYEKR